MEVLKRNKTITLILIIITIISAFSIAFILFQNTPKPSPTSSLLLGEVSQYQGQNLTSINVYISYLLEHPDVAIHGVQSINKAGYHLAITGLVNNPINYSYDEIVDNFNSTLEVATLPCVEGWSATLLWQEVPITDLLQQAGVSPNATTLIFLAADGYTTSLPLDYVKQNNITIAYKINNVTLTPQTGFPFFLVAKNQYGYKWIEWLTEINVSNDSSYLGYWESQGYPNNATVRDNATQVLSSVSIITGVIAFSIPCIAIAGAIIVHRRKIKKAKISMLRQCFYLFFATDIIGSNPLDPLNTSFYQKKLELGSLPGDKFSM